MTYAIIETGGKQLRVEPGRFYDIELLKNEPDETVTIETVLLVQHNGEVTIGQPLVAGATVEGTIMRHLRGRKVIVYKMRPKKKTRKKRGHRQEITRLMINSISLNGSVFTAEDVPAVQDEEATVAQVVDEPYIETVAEVVTEPTSEQENIPVEATVETTADTTATEVALLIPATPTTDEVLTSEGESAPETPAEAATPSDEATMTEVAPEVGEYETVSSNSDENPVEVAENAAEPDDRP
jgi:large subunit ribosomal protein L21